MNPFSKRSIRKSAHNVAQGNNNIAWTIIGIIVIVAIVITILKP